MPQHRWAFERGILYATDLRVSPVAPRLEAVFQEVGRGSVEQLAAAMNVPDTQSLLTRFSTGRRCFGAWIEGRIAAYGWVSRAAECIGEQKREIRLEPGEMYIWDCATRPECRGRRLYSALLSRMIAALREEGVRQVWRRRSPHPERARE
jgi:ribosomal protein S18 acetylase RimI-like enzyme